MIEGFSAYDTTWINMVQLNQLRPQLRQARRKMESCSLPSTSRFAHRAKSVQTWRQLGEHVTQKRANDVKTSDSSN